MGLLIGFSSEPKSRMATYKTCNNVNYELKLRIGEQGLDICQA